VAMDGMLYSIFRIKLIVGFIGLFFLIVPELAYSQVLSPGRYLEQLGHSKPVTMVTRSTIHGVTCHTSCTIDWQGGSAFCVFHSLQPSIADFVLRVEGTLEFRPPNRVFFKADYVDAGLLFEFDRVNNRMRFVRGFGGAEGMTWNDFELQRFTLNERRRRTTPPKAGSGRGR